MYIYSAQGITKFLNTYWQVDLSRRKHDKTGQITNIRSKFYWTHRRLILPNVAEIEKSKAQNNHKGELRRDLAM